MVSNGNREMAACSTAWIAPMKCPSRRATSRMPASDCVDDRVRAKPTNPNRRNPRPSRCSAARRPAARTSIDRLLLDNREAVGLTTIATTDSPKRIIAWLKAGKVLGVLNLHHSERPDAFSEDDLDFAEQLGRLDAEIIARAQEHEALRSQAARYEAVRQVRQSLSGTAPLFDRLSTFCRLIAERLGGGIVTVYLHDPDGNAIEVVGYRDGYVYS